MKNLVMFFATLLLSCSALLAQQRTISGTVFDGIDGTPMLGANVILKGTTKGTVTSEDGTYKLEVTGDKPVLVFSCIGYKTTEVTLKPTQNFLNIELQEDAIALQGVVAVGYGTMKKTTLSSAAGSVDESKIKGSVITNLDQALQGRVSGVSSVATSGAPGSSVSIRIRGEATINAGAEPLYVIDGVIIQSQGSSGADYGLGDALGNGKVSSISPLSTINPSDIVSMEILKDAAATAIYGAQGANGVVLITTKRGKAGEATFSYEGSFGVQRQNKRLDMMNLREFAEYSNSVASESNALDTRPEFQDPSLLGDGTNWQDAIFRDAMMQQHQISARGGTDKIQYYLSGGFMDQEGTIIGTDFQRVSFRANIDAQMKKWLKVGMNANYSSTKENLGLADGSEGIVNFSLLSTPDVPIYDLEGNYATVVREGYTRINPIAMANDNDINLRRNKLFGNIYADVNPYKGLTWHAEFGFDLGGSRAERFYPAVKYGNYERAINSSAIQENNNTFWQLKNYVTYAQKFDKHDLNVMVGQECWESKYRFQSTAATNLPSNSIQNPSLGTDEKINNGFGSSAMVSFFGRATYSYNDKYNLTYNYRRDGSSNFGPNNRWANFQGIAGSWRLTEEAFFEPVKSVINDAKIRLSWGQTGNANIGGYKWGASISKMPTGLGLGYRQSNISNPYIKWETQEQANAGIDLIAFNNRVMITAEVYDKTSKDMLMSLQLPSYMGTRGNASSALAAPWGNYGTINNRGLELSLVTKNITGAFTWDSDFKISFNKNKLKALDGTAAAAIEGYGQWSDVVTLTHIGESLFSFYGYKVAGIYTDLEDLQNSPKPESYPSNGKFNRYNTTWVGDIKYEDLSGPDGVPDGIIDSYDRTKIGSPFPLFTFGFENTFSYKNFDLSIFISGSYGNDIYNYMAMNLSNMKSTWDNQLSHVTNRAKIVAIDPSKTYPSIVNGETVNNWFDDITNIKVASTNVKNPRAIANDPNDNDRISDRYIEDGSYLRIKTITLGYTLPIKTAKKMHLESLRIYGKIDNLHTFTNYSGYDPEIGASTASPNVYGLDNGRYPSPQIYTLGVNISF